VKRGMVLREDYVAENNVTCEKCNSPAYATYYDFDWEPHEYCKEHLPIEEMEGK
jgi:hypothetical protein